MELTTTNGYSLFDMSSMLQKAIRRADVFHAAFAAKEMHPRFRKYLWKRLLTVSAEDCYGIITKEIEALWQGYTLVNKGAKEKKGRIFISKAVLILCDCRKNRDADHLQNFIYDRGDVDVEKWFDDVRRFPVQVPEYTFDVHTLKGKKKGMTKEDFFRDEMAALTPREPGLFDDLVK